MPRAFLSFNSQDATLAGRVCRELQDCGWEVFYAPWSLHAGAYWLPELATQIDRASAFVLLIAQPLLGPWQLLEYYAAMDKHIKNPGFTVLPVVIDGVLPKAAFLRALHWLALNSAGALGREIHSVLQARDALTDQPAPWLAINPYKGLQKFDETDSDYYVGREQITRDVVAKIRGGARIIFLIGNSGVGKSSIVDAGVVASLRRQQLPTADGAAAEPWPQDLRDSRAWLYLFYRPTQDPFAALARLFVSLWTQAGSTERDQQAEQWSARLREQGTLDALLLATGEVFQERQRRAAPRKFVLVIDQGEEIFTKNEPAEAQAFCTLLARTTTPNLLVIGSLRSDRYGNLQAATDLFRVLIKCDVLPLTQSELSRVIATPARKLGVRFESADIDAGGVKKLEIPAQLAANSVADPGALPFLAYVLEDAWKRMQKRADTPAVLRWADLPAAGSAGIGQLLADRAEDYWKTLAPADQAALERLFTLRLVQVFSKGGLLRNRAHRCDCSPTEWQHAEKLAGEDWRLVVTSLEANEPVAELAHDVLLDLRWQRFKEWIGARRSFLIWQTQLELAREQWLEARGCGGWLTGTRLREAQRRCRDSRQDLTAEQRKFIAASHRERMRWPRRVVGAAAIFLGFSAAWAVSHPQWHRATLEVWQASDANALPKAILQGAVISGRLIEGRGALRMWNARGLRMIEEPTAYDTDFGVKLSWRQQTLVIALDKRKPQSAAVIDTHSGRLHYNNIPIDAPEETILPTGNDSVIVVSEGSTIGLYSLTDGAKMASIRPRVLLPGMGLSLASRFPQLHVTDDAKRILLRDAISGISLYGDNGKRIADLPGASFAVDEKHGRFATVLGGTDLDVQMFDLTTGAALKSARLTEEDVEVSSLASTRRFDDGVFFAERWEVQFSKSGTRLSIARPDPDVPWRQVPVCVLDVADAPRILEKFVAGNTLHYPVYPGTDPVLVWATADNSTVVWPLSADPITLPGQKFSLTNALRLSPDFKYLAIHDAANHVSVWDLLMKQRIVDYESSGVMRGSAIRFSIEHNALVITESGATTRIVELAARKILPLAISEASDAILAYDASCRQVIAWSSSGEVVRYRHGYNALGFFVPAAFCNSPLARSSAR